MKKFIFLAVLLVGLLFPKAVDAARGCCSWHGGVDYCDSSVGRYVCNDGTYSPSCGCYRAPVEKATPKPTSAPIFFPSNNQTPPTSSSDSLVGAIVIAFFGIVGAIGLMILGAITNWFRRPDDFDKKFVRELMKAQEEVYEKDKTYMVTSPLYLGWEHRSEAVDNMVCQRMDMSPYRFEKLIKKPSIKNLYRSLANARDREKGTRSKWAIIRWGEDIWRWGEDRAPENIFYSIVLYPIGFALSIGFTVGMFSLLYFIPLLAVKIIEFLGWWTVPVVGVIAGIIYLKRKK